MHACKKVTLAGVIFLMTAANNSVEAASGVKASAGEEQDAFYFRGGKTGRSPENKARD